MKRNKPISLVTPDIATPEQIRAVKDHEAQGLTMTNMKRTILHNVPAFESFSAVMSCVNDQLEGKVSRRAMTIFCYAISHGSGCLICGNHFRWLLSKFGITDMDSFEFTEEEQELLAFAEAMTEDINHIPHEVYEPLQKRYDEETLVVLLLNAVLTKANNHFNNIVGVELDEHLKPFYVEGEFD